MFRDPFLQSVIPGPVGDNTKPIFWISSVFFFCLIKLLCLAQVAKAQPLTIFGGADADELGGCSSSPCRL